MVTIDTMTGTNTAHLKSPWVFPRRWWIKLSLLNNNAYHVQMCEAILFIFLIEGLVFPTHLPSPSKLTYQSKMFPSFILNNRITPFIFSISLMKLIRNTEKSRLRSKPNHNLETRERLNSLVTKLHMKILVELADVVAPPIPPPPHPSLAESRMTMCVVRVSVEEVKWLSQSALA